MTDYTVILSARNSSSLLPNKSVVSYCPDGTPNITQIIRRWQASRRAPLIVVATSDTAPDDSITTLCYSLGVPCYRGSLNDVVERMDGAINTYASSAKHVARALADNPLVDVGLADWHYDVLCETGADGLYYGGDESRITYAGTTDIFSRAAWDKITRASTGKEREHPGMNFWDNISKYSAIQLPLPPREYLAPVRTELDTPEDLMMFKRLWDYAAPKGGIFSTIHALETLAANPSISAINAQVQIKTQSKPSYGRGAAFVCRDCQRRTGTVDAGNLVLRCSHCGRPQKFYSVKPAVKPSRMNY
jgi:spore coat polysaccharide biosynthesis protein SpsF